MNVKNEIYADNEMLESQFMTKNNQNINKNYEIS